MRAASIANTFESMDLKIFERYHLLNVEKNIDFL
mgnify:FL=1